MSTRATDLTSAVNLFIPDTNRIHDIINGDATTEVAVENGFIPSIRKVYSDSLYFLSTVLPWEAEQQAFDPRQLYNFNGLLYWAPTATASNPVSLGLTPVGNPTWHLAPIKWNYLQSVAISNNTTTDNVALLKTGIIDTEQGVNYFYDADNEVVYFSGQSITGNIQSISSPVNSVVTLTMSDSNTYEILADNKDPVLRSVAVANNTTSDNVAFLYDGAVLTGQDYLYVIDEEKTYFFAGGVSGNVSDITIDDINITVSTLDDGYFAGVDVASYTLKLSTFNDLVKSSISAGFTVETSNYYEDRQGGGQTYKIYEPTDSVNVNGRTDLLARDYVNEHGVPELSNGNIAIPVNNPTLKTFGAISDSSTDNSVGTDSSDNFQSLINFCAATSAPITIDSGKFYAHDLVLKESYNSTLVGKRTPTFVGYGQESSIIFTNGNNFLDVGELGELGAVYGRNFSVVSKIVSGIPSGVGIFSSSNSSFRSELSYVSLDRFDITIDASNGSWGTKLTDCQFRFTRTALKLHYLYSSSINRNNFIAKTVLDTGDVATIATEFKNNHIALATYGAIFDDTEETFKIKIESFTWDTNYLETYDLLKSGSVIFDITFASVAEGCWRGTQMNLSNSENGVIARRINANNAYLATNYRFENSRIITPNPLLWWEAGDNVQYCYIYDDRFCDKADSKIIPYLNQKVASRIGGLTINSGEEWDGASNYIDTTTLEDINLINSSSDRLALRSGIYNITVSCVSPQVSGDVNLRIARDNGEFFEFPIAKNDEAYIGSVTQQRWVGYPGDWKMSLVNNLSSGDSFYVSDLIITIVPVSIFNVLV